MILPRIQVPTLPAPFNPYALPGLAAAYDASDLGSITADASNRVSQWNDKSGFGRHLLQATGSAQPLLLRWSGANYGYLPGVSGNYFSTPDRAFATTQLDIIQRINLVSWAPGNTNTTLSKADNGSQNSVVFSVRNPLGVLRLSISAAGSTYAFVESSVATGFAANATGWIRVTWRASDGLTTFYTAADNGSNTEPNWTQLGTTQTLSSVGIFDSTAPLYLGCFIPSTENVNGLIYYTAIRFAINGAASMVFDASQAANNATSWASSTGETWTVNQSGAKPAQIVGRTSLLFDGSAYYLKAAAFTMNQPIWAVLVWRQDSWIENASVIDGNTLASTLLYQHSITPKLNLYAGSVVTDTGNLVLKTVGISTAVWNGPSSLLRLNLSAAITGDPGAQNAGGLTLGSRGDASNPCNLQAQELIVFTAAPDVATQNKVIKYLGAKWGIAV